MRFIRRPGSYVALEEFRGGMESPEPVLVGQKAVHFVRKDELLDLDITLPKPLGQVHAFAEGNITVVVAVDEEHGRAPGIEESHG